MAGTERSKISGDLGRAGHAQGGHISRDQTVCYVDFSPLIREEVELQAHTFSRSQKK